MKFLIMQSSAATPHFLPLRSIYSPHHPVLRSSHSVFLSYCQRPSFAPIQSAENYTEVQTD